MVVEPHPFLLCLRVKFLSGTVLCTVLYSIDRALSTVYAVDYSLISDPQTVTLLGPELPGPRRPWVVGQGPDRPQNPLVYPVRKPGVLLRPVWCTNLIARHAALTLPSPFDSGQRFLQPRRLLSAALKL